MKEQDTHALNVVGPHQLSYSCALLYHTSSNKHIYGLCVGPTNLQFVLLQYKLYQFNTSGMTLSHS